jgi:predicted  nucleic acid-binding Zn-ribbon protein
MSKSDTTVCRHCHNDAGSGIHNGCLACGKVKHTADGRKGRASAPRRPLTDSPLEDSDA